VKRLILVLVLALVANWAGGAFVAVDVASGTQTLHDAHNSHGAQGAHETDLAASDLAPCHDLAGHTGGSADTGSPPVRHACCPAVGLPHTLAQLHLTPTSGGMMPPPTVHAYADVIFSIDKPPKTGV
jgi:hypothetical protein